MNINYKRLFFIFLFFGLSITVVFLRFYRVPEYLMFLSDQGRDAIVLKRLVTLEKLVFVGPTTSIGNVFTGPFYYYLVAPFLLLSRLDPVGPAYGIAFINALGLIGVTYFLIRRFGNLMGFIFLSLAGLSATQILQSRYSWNPNPVPLFAFITIIFWQKAIETKKPKFFALTGLFFGFCMQLHYITIVLLLPLLFSIIIAVSRAILERRVQKRNNEDIQQNRKKGRHFVLCTLYFVLSFILTFTPLILFEIKNKFITLQTFLRAFGTGEVQAKNISYMNRLGDTIVSFLQHALLIKLSLMHAILFMGVICSVVIFFMLHQKKVRERQFLLWLIFLIVGNVLALARLETGRHVHYFSPSYWPLYALIAYAVSAFFHKLRLPFLKLIFVTVVCVMLGWYVRVQAASLYFFTDQFKPYTQVTHAKEVAQYIIGQKTSDGYQVVGLPFFETEGHYRYFLEYLGHRPMPADTLGDPKELFVICHELDKPDCDIPGNPQWQIADFQNRHPDWKVESKKLIDEVRVFKLTY